MDFAGKTICLTKMEFDILASAVELPKLICFREPEEEETAETLQERYNQSVFALYKREILVLDKEGFTIQKCVEDMFRVMKMSGAVIAVESNAEETLQSCFYFDEKSVVTTFPGTKKGEYIKMSCSDIGQFGKILKESGVLLEEMLPQGLRELQTEEELCGISEEQLSNASDERQLLSLPGVRTVFTVYSEKKPVYIGIIRQPLQDKMFIKTAKGADTKLYSIQALEEALRNYYENEKAGK